MLQHPGEHTEVTRRGKSYVLSADAEAQTGDKSAKCGEVVRSTCGDTKYSSDEERDVEGWFAANYVCKNAPGSCFPIKHAIVRWKVTLVQVSYNTEMYSERNGGRVDVKWFMMLCRAATEVLKGLEGRRVESR